MELGPASIRLRSSSSSSAPPKVRFATTRYRLMRSPPRSLPPRILQDNTRPAIPCHYLPRSLIVNAENTIAQAPTGGMGQAAALRCRVGHAPVSYTHLTLPTIL